MDNPFTKNDLSEPINLRDNKFGGFPSKVRIVVYVDFADPDFLSIHAKAKEIVTELQKDVTVVYRHLPDIRKFAQAYAAAQALQAAAKQERFWEMLEYIVANQDKLSDGFLRQYAREIGLDKAKFEDDFSSDSTRNHIQHDVETAKESGVESAPAIFVNGVRQSTLSMRYIKELSKTDGNVMG